MTKKVIGIAAALVLLAAVVPLFGQWQGETRITNNSGSSYTNHYGGWGIAADDANVHIAWYDYTTTQRIRYFTFPIGSPTTTPNGEAVSTTYGYYPSIAIHDGTVDVSWYYSSTYDLYTREKNGSWGPIINHGPTNNCYYPAIAFDSDGDLHNVFNRYSYVSGDARGYSVYYQRKNSGAGSYSSPVRAFDPHSDGGSASSTYYARYPSICVTSDDAIHVSVAHNNGYRLKHVWSTDNGASWNHETIGGTNTAYYSYGTSICHDSDDNLYIAYVSYTPLPRQVYVATNASGSWVSTQVSQSTYNYTYYPSICCDKNNNVWVSWDDRSGTTYEVHYNKYDALSGSWEGDSALTTDDGQYSRNSNIAADENGNVHICWYDRRDGNYEVYYNWYKGIIPTKPPFVDTLFCEYFEGSWLPPGWSQIIYNHTINYYPCTWYHGNYPDYFIHGSYAAEVWWSNSYQNEWLKTFSIDLTGYDPEDSVDLTLGSAFYGTPAVNNFICVSTDGGATWSDTIVDLCSDYGTTGWTYIDDYPNPLEYRISEYIGETIMIGFNYYWFGASGTRGVWSVDDVCVIVSGGSLGGPGADSLDLEMMAIIRPKTEEVANVPFTPEILVVNNLDSTAHARISCKIKEIAGPTVYEDILAVVPLEPGENDIYGFKSFTPEGGKEYNALFVLEHPDDINPDNDHLDKNFHATVGMDVTPFEIVLPADVQDGSFAPTAKYTEKAGAETETNVICEITESGTSVYKKSVSHTFTADETWTATFTAPDPELESGTYTITFWAENPLDGSNISFPPISKTFTYTTSIAETPVPERTSLEVLGHTVNFALSEASHVNIRVYDAAGKAVTTLVDGSRGPGSYTMNWNTSGVAAGVYFVRMITPEFNATCKVMILH